MKTWQLLKNNPHLFQRYFIKEYLIKACRAFFEQRNYHELESPILTSALPQERYLDVLDTNIQLKNNIQKTAYIVPTTETFNKKILAAGLGEHFVITKVARGLEDIGQNHSPEFTMLEWYHLDTDYFGIMKDCEELFLFIRNYIREALRKEKELNRFMVEDSILSGNTNEIIYQGETIDFSGPWDKVSIPEALEEYVGVKLENIIELEALKGFAKSKGYFVTDKDDWQAIFELIFVSEVESKFAKNKPTFVYNYPKIMCPLTKENSANPLVCEKVELYIAGKEVGNGYTELLDWQEQEKRFLVEQKARKEMGMKEIKMDYDLVEALKSGLPNVGGIGIGLDRVAMIFANAKNISEINFFPASEMFED